MQKYIFCFLILGINLSLGVLTGLAIENEQGEIYKQVDETGVVQYTDEKIENSVPIKLPRIQVYPAQALETEKENKNNTDTQKKEDPTPVNYQLVLMEPVDNQIFTSDMTEFFVKVSIKPALQASDQVQLYLNGAPYGKEQKTGDFVIKDLFRGEYKIKVAIVAESRQIIKQTSEITIHQQRQFIRPDKSASTMNQ